MSLNPANLATAGRKGSDMMVPTLLEGLAASSRGSGTCLIALHADGQVAFHDSHADAFYQCYVVPLLRRPETAASLAERIAQAGAPSTPSLWEVVPGVACAAVPVAHRRRLQGVLLLTGKRQDFRGADPAIERACHDIKLDRNWLSSQADCLPGQDPRRLVIDLNLLLSLLSERTRVAAAEQELNSLSVQLANAYEELTLIEQITGGMRVNRGSADFFHQACLDVMQVISLRGMGVALQNDRCREHPVLYGEIDLEEHMVHRLGDQLVSAVRERKGPLLVNSIASDPAFGWLAAYARRLIAVPLQRGDQVLGCLFGLDKATGDFDSVDSKLLTSIANESAIYLENALLFGDVHDLMMGLLHALTSAVDAKDAYTCGHSERVALVGRHLAVQVGLSEDDVEKVYMAGLLHDVGKIGVPESVLQKTGRLTPEEFEQIKKHPQIGARILADVKQLEGVVPGVLHHHERYDGHGYPAGLSGKDIPLFGRIICLADCFDAMTSSRTYRKALPLEVAMAEIRRCSGTQFDPALAEAFLQITAEQLRLLLREYQQQARKLIELQQSLRAA